VVVENTAPGSESWGTVRFIMKYTALLHLYIDVACLNFKLSDEVNYGTWQIQANLKVNQTRKIAHNCLFWPPK